MDLDMEVQNASLESWLEDCMENVIVSEVHGCDNQFIGKNLPTDIPEISERDVTSEIEKLTSADETLKSNIMPEIVTETSPCQAKDTLSESVKLVDEESAENIIRETNDEADSISVEGNMEVENSLKSKGKILKSTLQENIQDEEENEEVSSPVESLIENAEKEDPLDTVPSETPSETAEANDSPNAEEPTYGDETSAEFLEPSCELAEEDDYENGMKSRFNLRKRNLIQSAAEDYGSDDYDPEHERVPTKKLKFNFSKKNYRRQRPYTNEDVKIAVKMVQSKKMTILEASRQYKIPRTSLHNFISLYKRGRRMGVRTISPALTNEEEREMVSLVIKLSRCGKRYSHNELRYLVQYYLISNDRPVFKSGTLPTMGWIAGLVERQPELTRAKSKKNTKVAVEDVEEWQKQIEEYLITDWDLDIKEMFTPENGYRIFCFNAFKFTINGPAESAENKLSPVKKEPGIEEEKTDQEVSAILGMSADGGFVVPLIVLSDENKKSCSNIDSRELRVMFNGTGRVDEEVALKVVQDFDEEIVRKGIPKPVVFFVNDKQDLAHFSVIEYCWENQIIVICLPPKTCRTMTPFEVSIWPKMRSSYATLWKNAPKNNDNKVGAEQFPDIFLKTWESARVVKQAIRGFTKSGLIPLDVPAILKEPVEQIDEPQIPEEEPYPDELPSLEERSKGKLEGIQMCLEAIEAFIPPDVVPVWNKRAPDYRGRCELAFKLWRSVSLLLKAGCAMASIQQMADGFFNPFGADFTSTASFFQKNPTNSSFTDTRPNSPAVSSVSSAVSEKPIPQKRKLNKSIYSTSSSSLTNGTSSQPPKKPKASVGKVKPFVKLYQHPFFAQGGFFAQGASARGKGDGKKTKKMKN